MRPVLFAAVLFSCCTMLPAVTYGELLIPLFNEIDKKTGHDNHMVAIQLFGDHTEIIYFDGTDTEHLLPLLQVLQSGSRQPITIRKAVFHQFDVDNRGWVIIGICNRMKDAEPGIYVWSSDEVARSTARSFGAAFREMRNLPVEVRTRNQLLEYYIDESDE